MMTGSEGVSFLFPQLFFSQQRLNGQKMGEERRKKSVLLPQIHYTREAIVLFVWAFSLFRPRLLCIAVGQDPGAHKGGHERGGVGQTKE